MESVHGVVGGKVDRMKESSEDPPERVGSGAGGAAGDSAGGGVASQFLADEPGVFSPQGNG